VWSPRTFWYIILRLSLELRVVLVKLDWLQNNLCLLLSRWIRELTLFTKVLELEYLLIKLLNSIKKLSNDNKELVQLEQFELKETCKLDLKKIFKVWLIIH